MPYVLVRTIAEYPGQLRRIMGVVGAAALAVAAAAALLAVQLMPFVANLSSARIVGREQADSKHIDPSSLITAIAPWAQGGVGRSGTPPWYLKVNLIESMSYVGAAGLLLVVVAIAVPWSARAILPRAAWSFLVAATVAWTAVLYVGPVLRVAQELPVFSSNFVGRGRSVVGLLVAALAAVGLEVLLRRHRAAAESRPVDRPPDFSAKESSRYRPGPRRGRAAYSWAIWCAVGVLAVAVVMLARRVALTSPGSAGSRAARVQLLYDEVITGAAFLAIAAAAAGAAWWFARRGGRERIRVVALAALPVLAAIQALTLVGPFWPRVERSTFFPVTATHQYLIDHLGGERFTGSQGAMQVGADSKLRLRSLSGHAFADRRFAELVNGLPGAPFRRPTYFVPPAAAPVVLSPILDRLAVRYFVVNSALPVIGERQPAPAGGPPVSLAPDDPIVVPLGQPGPVRALTLTPVEPIARVRRDAVIEVTLRDSAGRELARSRRLITGLPTGKPFDVPIAAEEVPTATRMVAELRVMGTDVPVDVAGTTAGRPAVGVVAGGDGRVRLAQAWPA
ncbi:MAG TPA: hypothetical protein VHN18_13925, partial [Micromonosporaceae bacterium]|nr:hypothetical protein [Micromonosporaceae bacterium]